MSCSNFFDVFLKIFLFIIIIGPVLAVSALLTAIAFVANIFTLLYFSLIGWLCEAEICECHGKFIIEALKKPWTPLYYVVKKIYKFFANPLI